MNDPINYFLMYQSPDSDWTERSLDTGTYIIGRGSDCNIILHGNDISRHHAQLEVGVVGFWIMDMGSANGTQVDNNPLPPRKRVQITPESLVTISKYKIKISAQKQQRIRTTGKSIGQPLDQLPVTLVRQPEQPPMSAGIMLEPSLYLRYKQASGSWKEYQIKEGDQFIGRDKVNQIFLDSTRISRRHAKLTYSKGKLTILDPGSKNGIFKSGNLLTPNIEVDLLNGDAFQIEEFLFEVSSSRPVVEHFPPRDINSNAFPVSDGTVVSRDSLESPQSAPVPSGSINLLGHERINIGRAPDNQIVLNHPMISRYHAVIERMGTRARIINLHSANGVFVNGKQIPQNSWLNIGDQIKIGPYQLDFSGNEIIQAATEGYSIDIIGLNKWVSKTINLLKDISLSIGQNEFVALVGMSGAGKSTLMDAINGFRPATNGQVLVNNRDLYSNYAMFQEDIGNVPQKDIVHMELTPEQALDYAAKLRMPSDTSAQERKNAVKNTLEDLGLTAKKDVPISRISGGQLKRVSIGVELLTKPRLFFLDEPTSGLDPGTEYEMMKLLRRLSDQGRTIMIITHATKNVMFCDKAIILAGGGNLAFYGPPEKALEYFDSYRTDRERLEKDMEFDDIYRILQDEKRGKPEEWRERYLQSQFAHYAVPKLREAPKAKLAPKQKRHRISSLKQFFILTSRTVKCMIQDRASLLLTILLAPVLGLMNFIWGPNLFDPVSGKGIKVIMMWFIVTIIIILVGVIGSVREIVKENEIYKRERAVGLKILPYALSKSFIGIILAIYQATAYLLLLILLIRPNIINPLGFPAIYVTLVLGIIAGYLLGLLISSVVPNQNSAQIVMIAALVPQFLFAGVLLPLEKIPLGKIISPAISSRWVFEALVNSSGMGNKVVEDACWSLPKNERITLSSTQKDTCLCMGPNIFTNCHEFPGIQSPDFYDEAAQVALAQGEPSKPQQPTRYPTPTPRNTPNQLPTPTLISTPTLMYTPTALATPSRLPIHLGGSPQQRATDYAGLTQQEQATKAAGELLWRADKYQTDTMKQFDDYRLTREAQFSGYQDQVLGQMESYKLGVETQFDQYQSDVRNQVIDHIDSEVEGMENYSKQVENQFLDYELSMEEYGETLSDWERNRQEAIGAAETILGMIYDDYGRSFRGTVFERWFSILSICVVEFMLILVFLKRKDVI